MMFSNARVLKRAVQASCSDVECCVGNLFVFVCLFACVLTYLAKN